MRKTALALATATLLGSFSVVPASAASTVQPGLNTGAPTSYVMMSKKKKMMMMKKKKMMMKKKGMM